MVRVAGLPGSRDKSAAVSFIEWYSLDQEIILIMERPVPAVDLSVYIQRNGHQLDEGTAKVLNQHVAVCTTGFPAGVDCSSCPTLVYLFPTKVKYFYFIAFFLYANILLIPKL